MEIRKKTEKKKSEQAKRCLKKIERRNETGEGKSRWERERRAYIEKRGIKQREIKGKEENDKIWKRIEWEERRSQKEEREKRIRETKYNRKL